MKGYYSVNILADQNHYDKSIDISRSCRSRKEAVEIKTWLDEELVKAAENQDHMVKIDLPVHGKQIPRTLFIRPADYALISTSVVFHETTKYKGKIGFQDDDKEDKK